jgi:signal transduction histidine kinase
VSSQDNPQKKTPDNPRGRLSTNFRGRLSMSLRSRLALTYALFVGILVLALGLTSALVINQLFRQMVRQNVQEQSERIVVSMSRQYNESIGDFDLISVENLGMEYVHQGYVITVLDSADGILWDARACDMEQCAETIQSISDRMRQAEGTSGEFTTTRYPLLSASQQVGSVIVEAYEPYFYSENEATFLDGFNRFMLIAGAIALLLVIILSVALAQAMARPVRQAATAARRIAEGDFETRIKERSTIHELHELDASLNELAATLEDGERWQKRLTSDIAHELRTPLTTLRGNLEAMSDGVLEATPERLASSHEEAIHLTRLVDDLNQISLLEQENLVLRRSEFDLNTLLAEVVGQHESAATSRGLQLTLETADGWEGSAALGEHEGSKAQSTEGDSPKTRRIDERHEATSRVFADYDRIRQVLDNLLSNALKYTEQGEIRVRMRLVTSADSYEVSISDTGLGIAPDELPHVFERLYRADRSRTRTTGGVGIGLSVVQAIIAAHHGTVTAESEPGQGSTFTITLPRSRF